MDEVPLLLPNNPLAMPILEGIKTGALLMQSCDECHRYQYPPRPLCGRRTSFHLTYRKVSGDGTVLEVETDSDRDGSFDRTTPFLLALVELVEEDTLVIPATLRSESNRDAPTPGTPVRASFQPTPLGELALFFRSATEQPKHSRR